jgi:hypothetical protein
MALIGMSAVGEDSWVSGLGAWFTVHGSRFTVHGSRFTGFGSWVSFIVLRSSFFIFPSLVDAKPDYSLPKITLPDREKSDYY